MNLFSLYDCVDRDDPEGRTIREVNAAKPHKIPMGALVELDAGDEEFPSSEAGARMFVVLQGRDCDGSPLYWLCVDPDDNEPARKGFANRGWTGGYPEHSLTVIKLRDNDGGTKR